jgi:predicted O-methyltransferase YrrM
MSRLDELRQTSRCGDEPIGLDSVNGLIEMIGYAKPKRVLELGADRGVSTECFLILCEHVTVVDPWAAYPDRYEYFMERSGKYPNLTIVRDYSPAALASLETASFDLVYIDAVHVYQPIIDDARASHRLVKPGGWMAGHDYWSPNNDWDTIPAVDALFGKENIKVFSDGSWLARRPRKLRETPPATGDLLLSPSIPDEHR